MYTHIVSTVTSDINTFSLNGMKIVTSQENGLLPWYFDYIRMDQQYPIYAIQTFCPGDEGVFVRQSEVHIVSKQRFSISIYSMYSDNSNALLTLCTSNCIFYSAFMFWTNIFLHCQSILIQSKTVVYYTHYRHLGYQRF